MLIGMNLTLPHIYNTVAKPKAQALARGADLGFRY